jgi:hypothetical protein
LKFEVKDVSDLGNGNAKNPDMKRLRIVTPRKVSSLRMVVLLAPDQLPATMPAIQPLSAWKGQFTPTPVTVPEGPGHPPR